MGSVERERHRTRSPDRAHHRSSRDRETREKNPEPRDGKRKRDDSRERDVKRQRSRSRERATARDAPSRARSPPRTERSRADRDAPSRSERERVPDRDRERDVRDKDRDTERDRERDRDRGRDRERERERDGDRDRHARDGRRDPAGKEGSREPARENGRGSSKDPRDTAPRENGRDRERDHDRERDRDRGDRERERSDRDRHAGGSERPSAREARRGDSKDRGGLEEGERPPDASANGNGHAAKPEPLSLEELMRKRQAEALAASKPVFLTKKQREELALKKRQDAVAAQQGPPRAGGGSASAGGQANGHAPPRRTERDVQDRRRDDDKRQRDEEREREKELALIKAQYLGAEKKKKKVLKGAEKFKFNFDWEAGDDTSRDLNPLYNQTHEASLLFGRGLRAGVDRREQKKQAAAHEADLMRKLRESQGIAETREDRQRSRNLQAAADAYDHANNKIEKHWTDKEREDMTERDWRIFREDHNISYKGSLDKSCLPIRSWDEAHLPDPLLQAIDAMGYVKPSAIQMAAIPLGLKYRDVIGIAETGSGKTAAFVLPMLVYIKGQLGSAPKLSAKAAEDGPFAVILAPTRELAQQIEEEAIKMAKFTEYRFVSVVGGQSIEDQGFKLRQGCEVIIATPGRLIDCLQKSYAVLNQCNYVVMDEADRMIDLGFEPQVMGVLDAMPSTNLKPEDDEEVLEEDRVYRTTYMFSATMPQAVERLARKYLRRPVVITIGSAGKAVDRITQRVTVVKDNEKPPLLEREITEVGDKKVIVFANTKANCELVSQTLYAKGYSCTVLHSGKSQDQREEGLKGFRDGLYSVLVATDVAGRGIDVPDVAMVVNYDMPHTIENYTHRIGRTGRAGRTGVAVTFLTMHDTEVFYDLKQFLETNKTPVPPQLARHEAARQKPGALDGRPKRDQIQYAKH